MCASKGSAGTVSVRTTLVPIRCRTPCAVRDPSALPYTLQVQSYLWLVFFVLTTLQSVTRATRLIG